MAHQARDFAKKCGIGFVERKSADCWQRRNLTAACGDRASR
jgi:hypothetical protein